MRAWKFFCFFCPLCICATDYTWDPTSGNNWNNNLNWSPQTGVPGAGDKAIFDGTTTPTSTVDVDIAATPGNMVFQGGVDITFTDMALTLGGVGCPSLTFNDASMATWSAPLTLGGTLTLTGMGGEATFNAINSSVNAGLTVNQGIVCNLTQTAGGWIVSTISVDGTLNLQASNSLPVTGLTVASGGIVDLQGVSQFISSLQGGGNIMLSTPSAAGALSVNLGVGTFSGIISDGASGALPGSFELVGSGSPLILSGTNTYSGGTTILGGGLQISDTQNLGNPASSVYILTINGHFSGPSLHSGGFFDLSQGDSLGVLIGFTATIDTSLSSMSISAPIVGTGGAVSTLRKAGANTLTLSNAGNSYTGGTLLDVGTLQISSAGNLGSPDGSHFLLSFGGGTLQPIAALILPQSGQGISLTTGTIDTSLSSMEVAAVMSGTGPLTLIGASGKALTLSGANTYTGSTLVNSGTAIVNGSLAGVATVNGGTLKGTGTINGLVTVNSGGTLQPGSSIGTQSYAGGLTIASNGSLAIEVNADGQTSVAQVTGTATLDPGAKLQIIADPGNYGRETLTYPPFLTASSISGSFTSIVAGFPPGYSYRFISTATYIQLQLLPELLPSNNFSGNNKILAEYLNSFPLGTFGAPWKTLFALPLQQQASALEMMSPSRNAALTFNSYNTAFTFSQLLGDRSLSQRYVNFMRSEPFVAVADIPAERFLAQADDVKNGSPPPLGDLVEKITYKPPKKENTAFPYSIWLAGFGDLARQAGENQNPTFHMKNGGFLLGIERYYERLPVGLLDDVLFGGALGCAYSSIDQNAHFGNGTTQAIYGALYNTLYFSNQCYFDFAFWGNGQHMENKRNIFYPGYSAVSTSSHNAWGGDLHGAFGYDYRFIHAGVLEPFLSLDWAFLEEEKYKENGSNVYNMFAPSHFSSMLRVEAGGNIFFSWFTLDTLWSLRTKLSYVNKVPFSAVVAAGIVGAPGTFTVTAFSNTQNLFSAALEFAAVSCGGGFVSVLYDGEFGSGYVYNQLTAKIGYDF